MGAVLLFDRMPKCCDDCPCMYDMIYCQAFGKAIPWEVEQTGRPDWCLLKELPERKETKEYEWTYALNAIYADGMNQGWNDCLDAIEEKEDGYEQDK